MNIIGIDKGTEDRTVYAVRAGFEHICVVPPELGRVTGIKLRETHLVATTESGIDFILPR